MTTTMESRATNSPSPSPFGTFDAMSLNPVDDAPQLTVSPAQTTLRHTDEASADMDTPAITVDPPSTQESTPKPEEKKPVKKRKSWGQELPVPKTNLPPRKRAKTEDEKEQRRIERVLRNRAAAQTSRERKRLEVEKLEGEKQAIAQQNELLLNRLRQMEAENSRLNQQVAKLSSEIHQGSPRGSTPQSVRSTTSESPTLAPTLFKQEGDEGSVLDRIPFTSPSASNSVLSPTMDASDLKNAASDSTQHPAAVLCDLQCQSEPASTVVDPASMSTANMAGTTPSPMFGLVLATIIQHLWLTMTSAVSSTLTLPLSQVFHSLKTGSPLTWTSSPENTCQRHLALILWLISTPTLSMSTLTSTRSSNRLPPRSVFRIRLLTRLLECSPALARPLRDATSRALQLVAREMAVSGSPSSSTSATLADSKHVQDWAFLMTTIWAIDMIRKRSVNQPAAKKKSKPQSSSLQSIHKRSPRHRDGQSLRAKQLCLKRMRSSRSRGMGSGF